MSYCGFDGGRLLEAGAKQAAELVVRITEPCCWLRRFVTQRLGDEVRNFAVTSLLPVLKAARGDKVTSPVDCAHFLHAAPVRCVLVEVFCRQRFSLRD